MQTILGANGIIATELVKELNRKFTKDIKLVSRNPKQINSTDRLFAANLLDEQQTAEAVKGSEIVYLTAGLPYSTKVWEVQWPVIMRNVINACEKYAARLVFFDNVYMYGKTDGVMTEQTPFKTQTRKGRVRRDIATMLLDAIESNRITGMICRAPEFYGPRNTLSGVNSTVFERIKKEKEPQVLMSDTAIRTNIYTPDAGKATALLGNTSDAYNQTWHLPCDNNRLNSKQFIQLVSEIYGKPLSYMILKGWMIKMGGLFDPFVREVYELLYQYENDYIFDSSKFRRKFPDFKVTTLREGITEILNEPKK